MKTQIAYDLEALVAWAELVRARGILERAAVLVGVAAAAQRQGRAIR